MRIPKKFVTLLQINFGKKNKDINLIFLKAISVRTEKLLLTKLFHLDAVY